MWWALDREGTRVGRCPAERLMRESGLASAVRGKTVRTTVSDPDGARAAGSVKHQFTTGTPNRLWAADLTYAATWAGTVHHVRYRRALPPDRRLENEHAEGNQSRPQCDRQGTASTTLPLGRGG